MRLSQRPTKQTNADGTKLLDYNALNEFAVNPNREGQHHMEEHGDYFRGNKILPAQPDDPKKILRPNASTFGSMLGDGDELKEMQKDALEALQR